MNAEMLTALENDPPVFFEEKRPGGLFLQLSWNKEYDKVILELQTELEHRVALIDKNDVKDALIHPCIYVDDPASLFKSAWNEAVESEEEKPRTIYDQESDTKQQFPFGKGATNCECCGKPWGKTEPGRMITSDDFLMYLTPMISDDDLDHVLSALGDQTELIVCNYCLRQVTGKDIEF